MMQAVRAERPDLAHNIIDFARLLRDNDFLASPAEVQDALRAVGVIDVGDREEFYLALRTVFLVDPGRRPEFDEMFVQGFTKTKNKENSCLSSHQSESLLTRPLAKSVKSFCLN